MAPCSGSSSRTSTRRLKHLALSGKREAGSGKRLTKELLASLRSAELRLTHDHLMVDAALLHELGVISPLDDAAVFHEKNQIRAAHRGQAMRNHERGPAGEQFGHRLLDELLAFRVEIT